MEQRPSAVVARVVIAHLRQSVQAWMDSDQILPGHGSSLLATLDRAEAGLPSEEAARPGIEAFIDGVQALIQAELLQPAEARPRLEPAAAIAALLRSADGPSG